MFWADTLLQNLDKKIHHRIDDMKTPSGHAHGGSLRAVATHGILFDAMKKAGYNVDFSYVVNDMDPMDSLPVYLNFEEYEKHMGKPLFMIPAPDKTFENYAVQYANEYIGAFNRIGFNPKIFWSSQLYKSGQMNKWIKIALDNTDKIRRIYKEVADQEKPSNWYPFQVICPKCQKVGTSLVTSWDGREVYYECKKNLVKWAHGCGQVGRISPFDGKGKLMWKVDWPAHWAELKITVEGAGKDHFSAGGSRYVGVEIIKKIFNIEPPFGFLHEFLLMGGSKMSSSKGIGMTAEDLVSILPPEVGKFLFVKTPFQRAINFDPSTPSTIPDLFDEFDKAAKEWFINSDSSDLGRMFEASQIKFLAEKDFFIPRFRNVAMVIQMPLVDIYDYFSKEKKSTLTKFERQILDDRVYYAQIWLEKFASEKDKFRVFETTPLKVKELDSDQKHFLRLLADLLESTKFEDGNELQQAIYNLAKEKHIVINKAFQAIYISLLNKDHGPKAGWLIVDQLTKNKSFIIERFRFCGE